MICIFIKAEPNPAKLSRIKILLLFDPACASSGNISFPSAKLDGIKSHLRRSKICTGWEVVERCPWKLRGVELAPQGSSWAHSGHTSAALQAAKLHILLAEVWASAAPANPALNSTSAEAEGVSASRALLNLLSPA